MSNTMLIKLIHFGITHICIILFYWLANDTTISIEDYEDKQIIEHLRSEAGLAEIDKCFLECNDF